MKLFEGLHVGDLEDLVLPLISIDQYESKIDEKSIVVAFYVLYEDPAGDLNRFLQKSPLDILDTEVSSIPTEDGLYMVFVEILNTDKFAHKVERLLSGVSNLTNNHNWTFKYYKDDNVYDFSVDKLKELMDI